MSSMVRMMTISSNNKISVVIKALLKGALFDIGSNGYDSLIMILKQLKVQMAQNEGA